MNPSDCPSRPSLRVPPPVTAEGRPVEPAREKSFLEKYWVYVVIALLCMSAYLGFSRVSAPFPSSAFRLPTSSALTDWRLTHTPTHSARPGPCGRRSRRAQIGSEPRGCARAPARCRDRLPTTLPPGVSLYRRRAVEIVRGGARAFVTPAAPGPPRPFSRDRAMAPMPSPHVFSVYAYRFHIFNTLDSRAPQKVNVRCVRAAACQYLPNRCRRLRRCTEQGRCSVFLEPLHPHDVDVSRRLVVSSPPSVHTYHHRCCCEAREASRIRIPRPARACVSVSVCAYTYAYMHMYMRLRQCDTGRRYHHQ